MNLLSKQSMTSLGGELDLAKSAVQHDPANPDGKTQTSTTSSKAFLAEFMPEVIGPVADPLAPQVNVNGLNKAQTRLQNIDMRFESPDVAGLKTHPDHRAVEAEPGTQRTDVDLNDAEATRKSVELRVDGVEVTNRDRRPSENVSEILPATVRETLSTMRPSQELAAQNESASLTSRSDVDARISRRGFEQRTAEPTAANMTDSRPSAQAVESLTDAQKAPVETDTVDAAVSKPDQREPKNRNAEHAASAPPQVEPSNSPGATTDDSPGEEMPLQTRNTPDRLDRTTPPDAAPIASVPSKYDSSTDKPEPSMPRASNSDAPEALRSSHAGDPLRQSTVGAANPQSPAPIVADAGRVNPAGQGVETKNFNVDSAPIPPRIARDQTAGNAAPPAQEGSQQEAAPQERAQQQTPTQESEAKSALRSEMPIRQNFASVAPTPRRDAAELGNPPPRVDSTPLTPPSENRTATAATPTAAAPVPPVTSDPSPSVHIENAAGASLMRDQTGADFFSTDGATLGSVSEARGESRALPLQPTALTASARPMTMEGLDVIRQVVDAGAAAKGNTKLELRLDPPELGRVEINFEFSDDRVSVVVRAEREEALDLMRRHAEDLIRSFKSSGVDLGSLDFGGTGAGDDREQSAGNSGGLSETEEPSQTSDRTLVQMIGGGNRLDIRI